MTTERRCPVCGKPLKDEQEYCSQDCWEVDNPMNPTIEELV